MRGFNHAGSTSDTFIARLKDTDAAAWEQFMNIHGGIVYTRYVEAGIDPVTADELTSDVVCTVYQSIKKFDAASFRGWLYVHARRRLVDFYRRNKRVKDRAAGGSDAMMRFEQLEDSREWMQREETGLAHELFEAVCQVQLKSPAEKQVVLDYLTKNCSGGEAARLLGLSMGAFYKRISRLLLEIRTLAQIRRDSDSGE